MASNRSLKFFKVLLPDLDFSQRLSVPPTFIELVSRRLPWECTLRGPSGEVWKVGFKVREDEVYFCKGWQRFVKNNYLEAGNVLVFKYDGNSEFDVTIYDSTCCEKDVKAGKRRRNQVPIDDEVIERDTEDSNEDSEEEAVIELDTEGLDEDSEEETRTGKSVKSGKRPATHEVKQTSIRTILFRSQCSCFIGNLKSNKYRMNIPKKIAVGAGLIGKKIVTLEDPNGKSWDVTLRNDEKKCRGGRLLMTHKWIECRKANNIRPEDTLVFELVNAKDSVMKIHIFRGTIVVLDTSDF